MTPYADLPERSFWKAGVARTHPLTVDELWQAKWELRPQDRIATAGSCFAQHVAAGLRDGGYRVLDVEPAPPWLDEATARAHGYGLFSARWGNIYTARQLLQVAREAFEGFVPAEIAWRNRRGRHHDALRPGVDPDGLASADEVVALREAHIERVRELLTTASVLVFTLGMTEAWADAAGTTVFPTAPGVIAGTWDPARYRLANFGAAEVLADLTALREIVGAHNRRLRMILTVSPVPLKATATGAHALVASTWSKSVLRAAAGELAARERDVDYFPSFELMATPYARGLFFEPDLRTVSPVGVAAAMRVFFSQHRPLPVAGAAGAGAGPGPRPADISCDEELLEALAG